MNTNERPAALRALALSVLLAAALTPAFAAGQKEAAAPEVTNFPVTIMAASYVPEPPAADAPVILEMQRYTGVKVDVQWMPSNGYDEKVAVTLASGSDMPMVMQVNNHKASNIVNAARAGVFWELTPFLKSFPNLARLDDVRLGNASIDGKVYGLYRQRPVAANGVIYNKGWLDKLGLPEPKTIDELYSMIHAFARKDPDGDGKDNTLGLAVAEKLTGYSTVLSYFGGPNKWEWNGKEIAPEFMATAYMDMLDFFKRLMDEGLMNSDFPVVTWRKAREMMETEKAGVIIGFLSTAQEIQSTARKINPDIVFDVFGTVTGPRGERTDGALGFAGQFVLLKPSLKNEAMLRHALTFFDKLSDRDMQNLVRWGFEGKHHVVENGYRTKRAEHDFAFNMEVNPFRALKLHYDDDADAGLLTQPYGRIRELYISSEPYAVINQGAALVSQTYIERGVELDKAMNDASVKYVLGAVDRKGFQDAINTWLSNGGRRVMDEYTADYKRIKNIP